MKYYSKLNFVRIKQKHYHEKLKYFRKIFGGFSVNYRQTAGDSYLSKYPTILVRHFLQVYLQNMLRFDGY